MWMLSALGIFVFSACSNPALRVVDELNERSYDFHYRSLDSTRVYAEQALSLAGDYDAGRAEALNNLAFYSIAKMEYARAYELLDSIDTNNQIELLVADVQRMRLCQRESKNKLFYDYRERAQRRLNRIKEELSRLNDHQRRRVIYAESEFHIVESTYFYYVGLTEESVDAIEHINPNDDLEADTAQLLNYLYNIGAGGIVEEETTEAIADVEFSYLVRCYQLAVAHGYPFFEAQALQGMGEHLENIQFMNWFMANNAPALALVNPVNMPDTLLAGYLAQQALEIFTKYGDVYQTAGAYRTLAECFWGISDYQSAEICLLNALEKDTAINQAPDLVASIREQLSLVYSAIDDKPRSDYNRNLFLDMQEQTRQDRQLEARYDQLQNSARMLNLMLLAVVLMIGLLIFLLFIFHRMRRRKDRDFSIVSLLEPLEEWKQKTLERTKMLEEQHEELSEQTCLMRQQLLQNKERNLEQRAKVSLANSIMPFVDRIASEVNRLVRQNGRSDTQQQRAERYAYVAELTDRINDYNDVLTKWIQMRQGEVSLRVESFPLQELFDIVKRGRMGFRMKGIDLIVDDTKSVVKADKTLTLFMINTIADNARKFTPEGGSVTIGATSTDSYVEVSIRDTGIGLTPEQQATVFKPQAQHIGAVPLTNDSMEPPVYPTEPTAQPSHGFGLRNCKGIIEKYRKLSKIFSVCDIGVESEPGRGSRFFFRLPLGRAITTLLLLLSMSVAIGQTNAPSMLKAGQYADSAYSCNIHGRYAETLLYADSCRQCLNDFYHSLRPQGTALMVDYADHAELPAELQWYRDSLPMNYDVIQSVRNESAVAALALHKWNLYQYNNKVYTQLFRELSADKSIASYCQVMQKSETNKNVAIILLVLLLLSIFPAYYMLYYRHMLSYRYSVERINGINKVLLSGVSAEEKLKQIRELWNGKAKIENSEHEPLNAVVSQICEALESAIAMENDQHTTLDLARDELRRVAFENDRLHISNNVLDNCLSTLKHETMYFPSRIRQLADGSDEHLSALAEVTAYYKDIYTLLTMQATRAAEGFVRLDSDLFEYLLNILKRFGGEQTEVSTKQNDPNYLKLSIPLTKLSLTAEQTAKLFTPFTQNVDFLLCRQIMRDFGEAASARGCGIQAVTHPVADGGGAEGGHPTIEITLTKQIWNHLKSSL